MRTLAILSGWVGSIGLIFYILVAVNRYLILAAIKMLSSLFRFLCDQHKYGKKEPERTINEILGRFIEFFFRLSKWICPILQILKYLTVVVINQLCNFHHSLCIYPPWLSRKVKILIWREVGLKIKSVLEYADLGGDLRHFRVVANFTIHISILDKTF